MLRYAVIQRSQLEENPQNPFQPLPPAEFADLVNSIRDAGILEPLFVVANGHGHGKYQIVSGHNRNRAAELLGIEEIPCLIGDEAEARFAIDPEIFRRHLSPGERSKFKAMREDKLRLYKESALSVLSPRLQDILRRSTDVDSATLAYISDLPRDAQERIASAMTSLPPAPAQQNPNDEEGPAVIAARAERDRATKAAEEATAHVAGLEDEIEELRTNLRKSEKDLAAARGVVRKATNMESVETAMKEVRAAVDKEHRAEIAEKDDVIADLNKQVITFNKRLAEVEAVREKAAHDAQLARETAKIGSEVLRAAQIKEREAREAMQELQTRLADPSHMIRRIDVLVAEASSISATLAQFQWPPEVVDDAERLLGEAERHCKAAIKQLETNTRKAA